MPEGVASPCVSICRMDEARGVCTGCLRTLDEIAAWSAMDDVSKRDLLRQLVQRRIRGRRADAAAPAQGEGA